MPPGRARTPIEALARTGRRRTRRVPRSGEGGEDHPVAATQLHTRRALRQRQTRLYLRELFPGAQDQAVAGRIGPRQAAGSRSASGQSACQAEDHEGPAVAPSNAIRARRRFISLRRRPHAFRTGAGAIAAREGLQLA